MKALRIVLAVVAVVAIAAVVTHGSRRIRSKRALDAANRLYEAAETPEELQKARQAYQAILDGGATGAARRLAEAGGASCEAHVAFLEARGRGSVAKHRNALEKMKRARDLSGDPQEVWADRIATFERELKAKLDKM